LVLNIRLFGSIAFSSQSLGLLPARHPAFYETLAAHRFPLKCLRSKAQT
jgi:hypothetical protein